MILSKPSASGSKKLSTISMTRTPKKAPKKTSYLLPFALNTAASTIPNHVPSINPIPNAIIVFIKHLEKYDQAPDAPVY